MTQRLRRQFAVIMILMGSLIIAGCGNFREQAQQAQVQLNEAIQSAKTAEDAAAWNAGRIIEMEQRIEQLEAAVATLLDVQPND